MGAVWRVARAWAAPVHDAADGSAHPALVVLPDAFEDVAGAPDVVGVLVRIPQPHATHDVVEIEVLTVLAMRGKIPEHSAEQTVVGTAAAAATAWGQASKGISTNIRVANSREQHNKPW